MNQRFDIAVVGAGMAGRLMALALDHAGFSVVQIDRAAAATLPDDGRTTAIAYAGIRFFKRLGLWEELGPKAEFITDILVSNGQPDGRFRRGGLTGGQLHFPATLLGTNNDASEVPALGAIIENKDLFSAFINRAERTSISQAFGAAVSTLEPGTGATRLTLANGETIEASLVVACDGKGSPLRSLMNLQVIRWSYRQKAIIFNIAHQKPHGGVAHEIFYPEGPFAILPMRNNHASIVWTERLAAADSYLGLPDEEFLAAAMDRIGDHLGAVEIVNKRQSYPLSLLYAPKLTADRFVLAGDAAHGIHPIAGQGFNLGIKDIAALVDVLTEARQAGLDIGHGTVLADYDRWRRFDGLALSIGTDALNRLFSNNWGPLKHARGLGLGAIQRIDPLRRFFMKVSGSDLGQLPSLMQPLSNV
ncbi:MAG: UbiH/UbiF/VisC/COQ6 family ubiquinone biosynthesis hydroxylase [Pseudomonadota bacterium]